MKRRASSAASRRAAHASLQSSSRPASRQKRDAQHAKGSLEDDRPTNWLCGDKAGLALVLLLIALYVSPYWITINGQSLQLQNDFDGLYYRYKAYLLDVLALEGRLPLWSPSEAAGVPFFSNPFSAAFYPLNLPLAVYYRLTGGYTSHEHKVFASLGVLILGGGLYAWLRSMRYPVHASAFAAVVAACGMKVTELMRFPNALHAAAWMPWFLWGVNGIVASQRRGWYAICLIAATILVLTAGYPYYAYYLQFLLGPYLALVFFARSRNWLWWEPLPNQRDAWKAAAWLAAAFGAGLAICIPYVVQLKSFLDSMHDRGGGNFEYATEHDWDWIDTLGSLLYPPASMAEGWYYFGMIGLLTILLYAVDTALRRRDRREVAFLLVVAAAFALLTCLTFGKDSYLFRALWYVWPGFNRLRVWSRINILLVPLIALVLARAAGRLGWFSTDPPADEDPDADSQRRLRWLAYIYMLVASLQLIFWGIGYVCSYYHLYFAEGPFKSFGPGWYLRAGLVSFAVLLLVLIAQRRQLLTQPARALGVLLGLVLVSMLDVGPLGLSQWATIRPRFDLRKSPVYVQRMLRESLQARRRFGHDTIQLNPSFSAGVVPNWYFERYVQFLQREGLNYTTRRPPDEPGIRAALRLLGCDDGKRLYVVRKWDHATAAELLADADSLAASDPPRIEVRHYNGDELDLEIDSPTKGYLCFIDNWDRNWHVDVNGQEAELLCVLKTFKGVALPAGRCQVRFAYRPWPFGK